MQNHYRDKFDIIALILDIANGNEARHADLKSMLSCLAGSHLILIEHMICCNTSAPMDNFVYFRLNPVLSV
jgi:hypothetical protein